MEHDADRELITAAAARARANAAADAATLLQEIAVELRRVAELRLAGVLSPEDARRFRERFDRAFQSLHFRVVEHADGAARADASEHAVRLEPCEGHFRLLAALRAYDGQGEFIFGSHGAEGNGDGASEFASREARIAHARERYVDLVARYWPHVPTVAYVRGVDRDGCSVVTWGCAACETWHVDDHEVSEDAVRCCVCGADFVLRTREHEAESGLDRSPGALAASLASKVGAISVLLLVLAYALILAGRVGAQDTDLLSPRRGDEARRGDQGSLTPGAAAGEETAASTSPAPTGRGAREWDTGVPATSRMATSRESGARASAALDQGGGAPPERVEADRLTAALARALTIWERPADGHVVYVHHCRAAPGGCEARLRAIAIEMIRAGRAHDVDPWTLAAMAIRESGLNPDAVGAVGEVGVLQLHPRSARGQRAIRACTRAPSRCTAAVIWLAAEALGAATTLCHDTAAALGAYNRGRCGATSYSARVLRQRERLVAWAAEASAAEAAAAEGDGPSSAAERGLNGESAGDAS